MLSRYKSSLAQLVVDLTKTSNVFLYCAATISFNIYRRVVLLCCFLFQEHVCLSSSFCCWWTSRLCHSGKSRFLLIFKSLILLCLTKAASSKIYLHHVFKGPVNFIVLHCVKPSLRPLAMAMSTVSIHIFGDVPSSPLVGVLQVSFSDVSTSLGLSHQLY